MPLQKQEIMVPFGGGLDTKTDRKGVIPGKLLELKNGVFHELKQITKRNGFLTPFSLLTVDIPGSTYTGGVIVEGSSIYRRGKELLITGRTVENAGLDTSWVDGSHVLTHDSNEDEWKSIGTREPLALGVETIVEPTAMWVIPDVALADLNKYACYAWLALKDPADATDTRNAHATVVELANNATMIDRWSSDVSLSAFDIEGVHVVGFDSTGGISNSMFYVWMAVPAENDVYLSWIDTTNLPNVNPPQAKITDLHGNMIWDVCTATNLTGTGPCSVVAYQESAAGQINIRWFDDDGNLALTRLLPVVPKGAITVFEAYDDQQGENKIVVAYQSNVDGFIYGQTYNADGTPYAGVYVINNVNHFDRVRNITGCRDTASDFYVANSSFNKFFVEKTNDNANTIPAYCAVLQFRCEFDGTNAAPFGNTIPRCCLGSKAWEFEDKARVWVVNDSTALLDDDPVTYNPASQNTYFQMSCQEGYQPYNTDSNRTDARCLGGEAGGQSFSQSLSGVVSPETDRYLFAGLRQDIIVRAVAPFATYDSVVGITTTFREVAQPSIELGPTAQTGGGYVGEADGAFQENNFHLYPECLIATITAIGGGGVDWQYVVVYEWTDREGQIHQSAPSIPLDVSCNDGDHVDIEVSLCPFGDPLRLENTRCVLYRTVDGPGNVFYRLPDASNEFNGVGTSIVLGDGPGANPALSDATLQEQATLYTGGLINGVWGVVPNICPPASSIMNVFQDRICLVPDEDRTNIWFSKIKRHAVGASFSDFFTKRITDGGDIIEMIAMDSRQIVFKKSEIRAFSGAGPIDTGRGSFSDDVLITSDAGCTDRASVVKTDVGIMFKALGGIYLLGRNLQVSYIGAPVEDYNNYKILKAELVDGQDQVRFLLEENPAMLVYDYSVNQWSIFEPPQPGEGTADWDTVDSAIWQDVYVMIKNDGTVYREGVTWVDVVGTYVPLDFTTAWIKLRGLQGYQRLWWISLLGEVYGQCTITVEISYDYVDTVVQTVPITIDAAFAAAPPAQLRIKPVVQKCEAFKIRVYDAPIAVPAGSQQGFSLSEIALQIGKKRKGIYPQGGLKTR